jgi:hypothetical protein
MLKSEPTDFNPLSAISIQLRHSCAQLIESIAHKPMARVSLVAVLGLGIVSWIGTAAIAPQSAHAYTANLEVSLSRQSRENFISFVRRAEAVARAAAQRSFDRDILVSNVAVTVIGQNNGAIAPVLKLNVSRRAWRSRPDPQRWITYLPNSESLLGFNRTTGEPEIPEPPPTPNQQPPQQRQQPTQPPQTIINIPGANIRLVPPPPQPTNLPPGAAGAPPGGGAGNNQNPNGGTGNNQNPNGGAGNNQNPNGGAGNNQNLNNGGAGNNQNPNGGAGNNQNLNNGGAGTQAPGQSNQQGGSGTNTR